MPSDALQQHVQRLQQQLADLDGLVIALSGGVDSAVLLAIAANVIGADHVLAVTAVGPMYPDEEVVLARQLAERFSVKHQTIAVTELDRHVAGNLPDRCYWCKREMFTRLKTLAADAGLHHVASGANASDASEHRPGARAEKELGILRPLLDAGLTKPDVRKLAKDLGLSVWDRPSNPCLATRIPYGTPLTESALRRIETAENVLHKLGFSPTRCRAHDKLARVEVPVADIGRAVELRETIIRELKALGFVYVTLDLNGFRSGAMDESGT